MKTKIKTIILLYICLILGGCKEELLERDDWTNHYGVEYKINDEWEHVHETVIDISELPNDFILEFKTLGVDSISVIGNDGIEFTILDPIVRDPSTGQIINEPFEYSKKQYLFKYLQKFHFKTNGEKKINVKFYYIWHIPNYCTCTLARQ